MSQYNTSISREGIDSKYMLSSLVINRPYKFDALTTSPKISKLLSFPFGIKIDSYSLHKSTSSFILSTTCLMLISCIAIFSLCLPIQIQNFYLSNATKSLNNKNLTLIAKIHEDSNYNFLLNNSKTFPLNDSQETIYLNKRFSSNLQTKHFSLNQGLYPLIQFSGF